MTNLETSLMKTPLPYLLSSSLTLMVAACIPDPVLDVSVTPVEIESEELLLTPAAPRLEQRLILVVSAKEGKKVRIGSASLWLTVSQVWKGPQDGTSEVTPWFRTRIVDERDGSVYAERAFLADTQAPSAPILYSFDNPLCQRVEERCEVPFRIEIEWQGSPAKGTVDVRWKATGHANADGVEGSDLEVRLVRPQEP
jgi:hypothetical protein